MNGVGPYEVTVTRSTDGSGAGVRLAPPAFCCATSDPAPRRPDRVRSGPRGRRPTWRRTGQGNGVAGRRGHRASRGPIRPPIAGKETGARLEYGCQRRSQPETSGATNGDRGTARDTGG